VTAVADPVPRLARARAYLALDGAALRGLIVEVNDGIIATAGIVEGFVSAGATTTESMVAAGAAMISGGIALGGAKYAEAAAERDAQLVLLEEERGQLQLAPEEELAELVAIYEAKGLSLELARQVAAELSEQDALAAHAEAEHGIAVHEAPVRPLVSGILAGLAFAIGSAFVLLTVVLAPAGERGLATFVAVVIALCLTSVVLAVWGRVPVVRAVVRNLSIGVSAMLLTFAIGSRFEV
jgi:VIT1/CCC1 family predicted Fe2+/Mn2+ transporter